MCVNASNLKYNIKKKLHDLPGKPRSNKYLLAARIDISERTFDSWLNTLKTDRFSIPSDALYIIADFFKCTPDQLLNRELPATNG